MHYVITLLNCPSNFRQTERSSGREIGQRAAANRSAARSWRIRHCECLQAPTLSTALANPAELLPGSGRRDKMERGITDLPHTALTRAHLRSRYKIYRSLSEQQDLWILIYICNKKKQIQASSFCLSDDFCSPSDVMCSARVGPVDLMLLKS